MKLMRFNPKKEAHHGKTCQFREWSNEKKKMCACGDKAVGQAGARKNGTPLCEFHLEHMMGMYNMSERDVAKER